LNHRESIFEAVRRDGLTDLLELAVQQNDRQAAALLLRSVGAESEAVEGMLGAAFGPLPD
jgi:hypothetical protein